MLSSANFQHYKKRTPEHDLISWISTLIASVATLFDSCREVTFGLTVWANSHKSHLALRGPI